MAYKTPGVYIVEKNAFPNSVVEVETAVPAFIGHTEKADNKGVSLAEKPWRITSMAQFIDYFGGPPAARYSIEPVTPAAAAAPDAKAATPAKNPDGTDVVVDPAAKPAVAATPAQPDPNAKVAPAHTADFTAVATGGAAAAGHYLKTDKEYLLYYSMQLFFQNGGGPCYIVSVGGYGDDVKKAKLTKAIDALKKEQEPTMLVIPEAVKLPDEAECIAVQQYALQHCGVDMKNRFAILDIFNGDKDRADPVAGDPIARFRDKLGVNSLNFGAAYYPWVDTAIVSATDITYEAIDPTSYPALKTMLTIDLKVDGPRPDEKDIIGRNNYDTLKEAVQDIGVEWKVWTGKTAAELAADEAKLTPADRAAAAAKKKADEDAMTAEQKTADAAAKALAAKTKTREDLKTPADIDKAKLDVHQVLSKFSPLYVSIMAGVAKKLNRLPPSAAMAGQYTMVDKSRGVWKAPANVSLNSVTAPAVNINHEEQADLNVTTGGKSVNAIRSFIGSGTLVWGARTLDGNSLDWRYINVRRTMIMLEESIKLATTAYVFEPNVANTWVTIKGMIRNFLTSIWKRGGLAGASPDDAFEIYCGLGETMTGEDILEGLLNVTVKVALSRPAEFIEITFQQQMQKS